ncbi:DUF5305 domain-containing protein [Halobaculum rubrum]|uniref:DUF5305 domain-containing protein n=1 Tax=Halobaculum rubrum TaxID=2872158 RepID=UPI001CA3D72A|nr:DUF5305 domain-containing protein [Halobaculum rubrum]QZX98986.1 DUF5305 family protein [Halobaculum rubrum]
MDEATRLRVRSALSSWLAVLLVVSFVVGGAGAWATYTAHVGSETETVERTTTVWTATGSFDHSATVVRANPLYPIGTTLTNRSTYFRSATPVLDGRFTVAAPGLQGNTSVELATTLSIESADEETTYWSDSRPLNSTTADGPATVAFSINTTDVADRIAAIESGIGSTPGETTVAVVVDVAIRGTTADGATSRLSFSSRLPVELNGDTYTVSDPGPIEESVERTVTERVEREYGPVRSIGGPIALLVGVVAIGTVGYIAGRGRPALTEAERARLEYLDDRSEFDQWIVSVDIPPASADGRPAEASSLADLVNLAIDTDNAVLKTPDAEEFHVVDGTYRYTYHAPPPAGSHSNERHSAGEDGSVLPDLSITRGTDSGGNDSQGSEEDDTDPTGGSDGADDPDSAGGSDGADDTDPTGGSNGADDVTDPAGATAGSAVDTGTDERGADGDATDIDDSGGDNSEGASGEDGGTDS